MRTENIGNYVTPQLLIQLFLSKKVDIPFNVTKTFGPMLRSEATPTNGSRCTVVGWGYTANVRHLTFYQFRLKINFDAQMDRSG